MVGRSVATNRWPKFGQDVRHSSLVESSGPEKQGSCHVCLSDACPSRTEQRPIRCSRATQTTKRLDPIRQGVAWSFAVARRAVIHSMSWIRASVDVNSEEPLQFWNMIKAYSLFQFVFGYLPSIGSVVDALHYDNDICMERETQGWKNCRLHGCFGSNDAQPVTPPLYSADICINIPPLTLKFINYIDLPVFIVIKTLCRCASIRHWNRSTNNIIL